MVATTTRTPPEQRCLFDRRPPAEAYPFSSWPSNRPLPAMTPKEQARAMSCLGLAYKLAYRYHSSLGEEEAIGTACFHLCRAAIDFIPHRTRKFTTLATPYIKNGLARAWQEMQAIRRGGRVHTAHLGGIVNENCEPWEPADTMHAPGAEMEEEEEREARRRTIEKMLRNFQPREREMFLLRYRDDWALERIGKRFGISKERVRQICGKVMDRVRKGMAGGLTHD